MTEAPMFAVEVFGVPGRVAPPRYKDATSVVIDEQGYLHIYGSGERLAMFAPQAWTFWERRTTA